MYRVRHRLICLALDDRLSNRAQPVQINSMIESKERLRILKWLSPLDFGPTMSDMLDRRQEGTGVWLLKSQLFTDWLKGDVRIIWCPGMREHTYSAHIIV